MTEILAFLGAFAATVVAIPPLIRMAPGWGLLAVSSGRKIHEGEVPLIGGIVMGLVFLAAYGVVALSGWAGVRAGLAAAIAIVLVGGILDDLYELRSLAKFGFQILAASTLIYLDGTVLGQLGQLLGERVFTLGVWAVPLTIFAVVGVMNAFNMADGIDGLAGTVSLLALIAYGVLAAVAGEPGVFVAACIGAGVTGGFLCFNARFPSRPTAIIFMGDTGSQFLGLLLAWCAIRLHNAETPAFNAVTAGWTLGVVLGDTLCVMLRRLMRGASPFSGDREHLHHLLAAAGLSVPQSVAAIATLSVASGAVAYLAERQGVPAYVMFYIYLTLLAAYCLASEFACRKLGMRGPPRTG